MDYFSRVKTFYSNSFSFPKCLLPFILCLLCFLLLKNHYWSYQLIFPDSAKTTLSPWCVFKLNPLQLPRLSYVTPFSATTTLCIYIKKYCHVAVWFYFINSLCLLEFCFLMIVNSFAFLSKDLPYRCSITYVGRPWVTNECIKYVL